MGRLEATLLPLCSGLRSSLLGSSLQAGRQDRKRSQSRYSQCSPQVDGWKTWLPPGTPLSTQLGANIKIRGSKMALGEEGAPQAGERAEWLDTPSPHSGPNAQ